MSFIVWILLFWLLLFAELFQAREGINLAVIDAIGGIDWIICSQHVHTIRGSSLI